MADGVARLQAMEVRREALRERMAKQQHELTLLQRHIDLVTRNPHATDADHDQLRADRERLQEVQRDRRQDQDALDKLDIDVLAARAGTTATESALSAVSAPANLQFIVTRRADGSLHAEPNPNYVAPVPAASPAPPVPHKTAAQIAAESIAGIGREEAQTEEIRARTAGLPTAAQAADTRAAELARTTAATAASEAQAQQLVANLEAAQRAQELADQMEGEITAAMQSEVPGAVRAVLEKWGGLRDPAQTLQALLNEGGRLAQQELDRARVEREQITALEASTGVRHQRDPNTGQIVPVSGGEGQPSLTAAEQERRRVGERERLRDEATERERQRAAALGLSSLETQRARGAAASLAEYERSGVATPERTANLRAQLAPLPPAQAAALLGVDAASPQFQGIWQAYQQLVGGTAAAAAPVAAAPVATVQVPPPAVGPVPAAAALIGNPALPHAQQQIGGPVANVDVGPRPGPRPLSALERLLIETGLAPARTAVAA